MAESIKLFRSMVINVSTPTMIGVQKFYNQDQD